MKIANHRNKVIMRRIIKRITRVNLTSVGCPNYVFYEINLNILDPSHFANDSIVNFCANYLIKTALVVMIFFIKTPYSCEFRNGNQNIIFVHINVTRTCWQVMFILSTEVLFSTLAKENTTRKRTIIFTASQFVLQNNWRSIFGKTFSSNFDTVLIYSRNYY